MKTPAFILMVVGAIFATIALVPIGKSYKIIAKRASTEGTVLEVKNKSKSSLRKLTVVYSLVTQASDTASAMSTQVLFPGNKVKVYYDPASPRTIDFGDTIRYNLRGVFIGGLLFALGLYLLIRSAKQESMKKRLMQKGRKVSAELLPPVRNEKYRMGDKNPWLIRCKWTDPVTRQECTFVSIDYSIDPGPHLAGRTQLDVYIDPADPGKYYLDASFMPKGSNYIG